MNSNFYFDLRAYASKACSDLLLLQLRGQLRESDPNFDFKGLINCDDRRRLSETLCVIMWSTTGKEQRAMMEMRPKLLEAFERIFGFPVALNIGYDELQGDLQQYPVPAVLATPNSGIAGFTRIALGEFCKDGTVEALIKELATTEDPTKVLILRRELNRRGIKKKTIDDSIDEIKDSIRARE
jgi:hypothetical protein